MTFGGVCIARFSACGCQKKSVVYEAECIQFTKVSLTQEQTKSFIALKAAQFWTRRPIYTQVHVWTVVVANSNTYGNVN